MSYLRRGYALCVTGRARRMSRKTWSASDESAGGSGTDVF